MPVTGFFYFKRKQYIQKTIFMRMICSLIFCIISFHFLEAQTAVIVKVTPDAVYIAADTKVKQEKVLPTGGVDTSYFYDCKILVQNKITCAFANKFYNIVKGIALTSFKDIETIEADFIGFKRNCERSLTAELTNLQKQNPVHYKAMADSIQAGNGLVSQFVCAGYRNSRLIIITQAWKLVSRNNEPVQIVPDGMLPTELPIEYTIDMGETDELGPMLFNDSTWKGDIKQTLIKLIRLAETYHPATVGGEISIIKITPKKIEWLSKPKFCEQK